jgi:predicted dehydrogenase
MIILTRKDFISVSAATLALHGALARKASANDKITIGIVGCGGMGKGDLNVFLSNADVDCAIVCDVDDARANEAATIVETARGTRPEIVRDFRKVIDRNDIQAVLVATPDHWHALPTIYACQSGKDVYCEKPLGNTIEECRSMLDASVHNNRVVQMGTQWRSAEHFKAVVECVQSGKLGKVRQVRAWAYLDWVGGIGNPPDTEPPAGVDYDMWLGPAQLRPFNPNRFHFNFRWYWDYAGGLMTDWGVHLINIVLWAMGPTPPKRIASYGGKRVIDDNTETPDTQIAVYDFPDYTFIWEHQMLGGVGIGGRPHGISFSGTKGTLIVDGNGWEIVPEPMNKELQAEKHEGGPDGRSAHVRNFLDCIKSREKPVENLEIGHFVSTVAHLGNIALRTGDTLEWDAEKERCIGNRAANQLVSANYRAPWKL